MYLSLRFLITFLFVTPLLSAQLLEELPAPYEAAFDDYSQNRDNRSVLRVEVINLPADIKRDSLFGYSAVTLMQEDQKQDFVSVPEDGILNVVLPDGYPLQEVWFWLGDHFYGTIYIKDEVTITMDYAALTATQNNKWEHTGVTFSGPDAALATYRSRQIATHLRDTLDYTNTMNDRNLSADRKHAIMDGIYLDLQKRDELMFADAPGEVAAILKRTRKTAYLSYLNVVYWGEDYPEKLRSTYREHRPVVVSKKSRNFYAYHTTQIIAIGSQKAMKAMKAASKRPTADDLMITAVEYFLEKVDDYYDPPLADFLKLYLTAKDQDVNTLIMEKALATMSSSWAKGKLQAR